VRNARARGTGLVEFALILPVLVLMLFSILDLGRGIYAYSVVSNSAREGARYGTIAPTDVAGIENATRNAAIALNPDELTVQVALPTDDTIRVSVTFNFRLVTPLVAQAAGLNPLVLHSTATMYTGY